MGKPEVAPLKADSSAAPRTKLEDEEMRLTKERLEEMSHETCPFGFGMGGGESLKELYELIEMGLESFALREERDRYKQALEIISRTDYVNEFNENGEIVRTKYPDDIANEALKVV